MSQGSRPDRVADQIRGELATLLAREVHDPGIGFVTLTRVQVSPDLQLARVLLHGARRREGADGQRARALERAAPFLRRQIGARLRLKRAPELQVPLRRLGRRPGPHRAAPQRAARRRGGPARRRCARRDRRSPMTNATELSRIVDAIRTRQRFVLSSHARPDGDSIGSQLAMAYALRALGKDVRLVNADPAPPPLQAFPGVGGHRDRRSRSTATSTRPSSWSAATSAAPASPASTASSSSTSTTIRATAGTARSTGSIRRRRPAARWCSTSSRALGVPLSLEIATHIYLAILTDTGSFHYSSISPRTFDICRPGARGRRRPGAWSRGTCTTATTWAA